MIKEENKIISLNIRLTKKEKENLQKYCKSYNITVSQFVRSLMYNQKGEISLNGRQHNRPPSQCFKWMD
jgi:antitoxin component of RelBE/YafQ-DinJ toxin-antitoxin module